MPKEESGRLFSKVAKFVRNPLKDWSELDAPAPDSSLPDPAYSREMLKEMIERRQRNDFVRRREFDMLRKLRQREAAAHAFEPTATPSSFNLSSTSEKSEGRAQTLKKIDEIEEQMSQQWWKGRGPNGETLDGPPPDAGAETMPPPVHAGELSRVLVRQAPVPAAVAVNPAVGSASVPSSRSAHEDVLEEAAIRLRTATTPAPKPSCCRPWRRKARPPSASSTRPRPTSATTATGGLCSTSTAPRAMPPSSRPPACATPSA